MSANAQIELSDNLPVDKKVMIETDLDVLSKSSLFESSRLLRAITSIKEGEGVLDWLEQRVGFIYGQGEILEVCVKVSSDVQLHKHVPLKKESVLSMARQVAEQGLGDCEQDKWAAIGYGYQDNAPYYSATYTDLYTLGLESGVLMWYKQNTKPVAIDQNQVLMRLAEEKWLTPSNDPVANLWWRVSGYLSSAQYASSALPGAFRQDYCDVFFESYACERYVNGPLALRGVFLSLAADNCKECTAEGKSFLRLMSANYLYRIPAEDTYRNIAESNFLQSKTTNEQLGPIVTSVERVRRLSLLTEMKASEVKLENGSR